MIIRCSGTAIIADQSTGKQFEFRADELDWQSVGGDFGPMGSKEQYQATIVSVVRVFGTNGFLN